MPSQIDETNWSKKNVNASTRIKTFFLVKRCSSKCKLKVTHSAVSSGNQRRCKHMHKWDTIFTPFKLATALYQGFLLPLWRQRSERRETLSTRLIWPDIRQSRACATFCFLVHYFDASMGAAAGIKRKKKNALGLALAFIFTLACFHDMCCFTCAYTFVRACVTNEN